MYPLVEWGHAGIIDRVRRLNKNELFYESVIASAQVFEQAIKRILRNELASSGMKIGKARMEDGGNGFFLIASTSLADTDQSLQQHCQSVNTMQKKPWNLVMNAPKIHPTLSELTVAITSQNDWECLTGKKKIEHARLPLSIHTLEDGCQIENIRCGLIAMRHQIVHQPNAPDLATIRPLAYFGESFLKRECCARSMESRAKEFVIR